MAEKQTKTNRILWFLIGSLATLIIAGFIFVSTNSQVSCGLNSIEFGNGGCCNDYNENQICDDMENVMLNDFKATEKCYEDLIFQSQEDLRDCSNVYCQSEEANRQELQECKDCIGDVWTKLEQSNSLCEN